MKDGRIIFANTLLQAQDLLELLPVFNPPPAFPFFGGGGGGGAGSPGDDGSQGPQGPGGGGGGSQGVQGPQGTNPGVQGPQGNQGLAGTSGAAGAQGNQGNQGAVGSGAQGNQGVAGTAGTAGVQGSQGNQGLTGTGAQGAQGVAGGAGVQGAQGNQGLTGSGAQGAQGNQGNQGGLGAQGAQGSGTSDPLDLAYFAAHGFLPPTVQLNHPYTMPAFDFVSPGGGSPDYLLNRAKIVPAVDAYFLWDLGATFTRGLFIVGLLRTAGTSATDAIFCCKTKNGSQIPQDGYSHTNECAASRIRVYEMPAFTPLGVAETTRHTTAGTATNQPGLAFWIDLPTNRIVTFIREGAEMWYPIQDLTDAVNITLDSFQYVGIQAFASAGGAGWIGGPIYCATN